MENSLGNVPKNNIVPKAFLNELSSYIQTSSICFKTEMTQVDKEERESNNKL